MLQKRDLKKRVFGVLIVILILFAHFYVPKDLLTLSFLKQNLGEIQNYLAHNHLKAILLFCSFYIATTALSIPIATLLSVLGGALFGGVYGTFLVLFSSTIGATISFLLSRYFFQDIILKKYPQRVGSFISEFEKDEGLYILSLRLVPIIPFFLINLFSGLTRIKLLKYMLISFFGMAPGALVYVLAGVSISNISSLSDIVSFQTLIFFVLLAILPFVSKHILRYVKSVKE